MAKPFVDDAASRRARGLSEVGPRAVPEAPARAYAAAAPESPLSADGDPFGAPEDAPAHRPAAGAGDDVAGSGPSPAPHRESRAMSAAEAAPVPAPASDEGRDGEAAGRASGPAAHEVDGPGHRSATTAAPEGAAVEPVDGALAVLGGRLEELRRGAVKSGKRAAVSAALGGGRSGSPDSLLADARKTVSGVRGTVRRARAVRAASNRAVFGAVDLAESTVLRASARRRGRAVRRAAARGGAAPRGTLRQRASEAVHDLLAPAGGRPGGAAGWLLGTGGAGAAALAVAALLLLAAILAGSIAVTGSSRRPNLDGLGAVERVVASYLLDRGLDEVHVAAILGNMAGESGVEPVRVQGHAPGDAAGLDTNAKVKALGTQGGIGIGLCQWDGGRRWALASYADSVGGLWSDLSVQLDFFWEHDEWGRGWGRGENTEAAFMAATDVETATRIFLRGWERAGVEHLEERVAAARRYLAVLTGAVSDGELSAAQRAVVDSCSTTPSPGAGLCAAWVSNVFSAAGQPGVPGNACDMYRAWCTSSDRGALRPGMIVAVPTHPHTSAGRIYGHVGIYVGNNTVMDNIGPIRSMDLDAWIAYFGTTSQVRWGWTNGRALDGA